ncbi:MAG: hypothetical protein ACREQJ_12790 [Candidatus Binatia bacterium]
MAQLSLDEFGELTQELVERHGLGRLQEKLLRSNVVVSRRRVATAEAIARALHSLTAGLAREGLASQIVLALWEEALGGKVDEESAKGLEELAEKINSCLDAELEVSSDREEELRAALADYHRRLGEKIGERAARLTMLTRAVPSVARRLRASEAA